MDFYTIEPCATSNAFELKFRQEKKIDLKKAAGIMASSVLASTPVLLVVKIGNSSATLYASGRIMMRDTSKEEAEKLGKKLVSMLEKGKAFI